MQESIEIQNLDIDAAKTGERLEQFVIDSDGTLVSYSKVLPKDFAI